MYGLPAPLDLQRELQQHKYQSAVRDCWRPQLDRSKWPKSLANHPTSDCQPFPTSHIRPRSSAEIHNINRFSRHLSMWLMCAENFRSIYHEGGGHTVPREVLAMRLLLLQSDALVLCEGREALLSH